MQSHLFHFRCIFLSLFLSLSFLSLSFLSFMVSNPKIHCQNSHQGAFSLCLLLVLWFQVLCSSLIHFKLILVYSIKQGFSFILFHVSVQFSQQHLFKELPFSVVQSWLLHCKLINCICLSLFLGFMSCSIDPGVCFMPIPL